MKLNSIDIKKLENCIDKLDTNTLLPLLKEWIISNLALKSINDKSSLKETLGFIDIDDEYLSDKDWFVEFFPDTLLMNQVVDLYNNLISLRK
jgi:hypothetical protein